MSDNTSFAVMIVGLFASLVVAAFLLADCSNKDRDCRSKAFSECLSSRAGDADCGTPARRACGAGGALQ